MSAPYVATSDERLLHDRVAGLTMKVARSLIYHNHRETWPKRLAGGTCFILRFGSGLVGVTADHVIVAFEDAKRASAYITSRLGTVAFDLQGAIIARDRNLDIATFGVTKDQLAKSDATEFDCRSINWQPPVPDKGDAISFGGFPEEIKKFSFHTDVIFRAYVNLTFVESVTSREIIATYDPRRDSRVRVASELPDVGANLSGCSGGPVLLHSEVDGLHRWFPLGLMVGGPEEQGTGVSAEFDMIRFRRIHVVQPGGTIENENNGWLPT